MLCIDGKLTGLGVKAGLVQVEAVKGSLTARAGITATLTADFISASTESHLMIRATLTDAVAPKAGLSAPERVTGALSRHGGMAGSLTHGTAIGGSLTAHEGIRSEMHADFIPAALAPVPVEASLTGRLVNAEFTFACPIDTIKACFSIGGWDNRLGWDNDLGWKN